MVSRKLTIRIESKENIQNVLVIVILFGSKTPFNSFKISFYLTHFNLYILFSAAISSQLLHLLSYFISLVFHFGSSMYRGQSQSFHGSLRYILNSISNFHSRYKAETSISISLLLTVQAKYLRAIIATSYFIPFHAINIVFIILYHFSEQLQFFSNQFRLIYSDHHRISTNIPDISLLHIAVSTIEGFENAENLNNYK